jgi:hypothetical protein
MSRYFTFLDLMAVTFGDNWLTPWSWVLFEKLTVTQLVNKFPAFMEPEGSLVCSQQLATGSCPELGEVKVKLSLCLTKHHAMKTDWGSGGIAPRILDLGARRRWVVSFTPRSLYSQGEKHRYPLLVGWVGPTAGLNTPSFNILVYFSNFCGFSTEIDTTASLKG